MKKSSTLSQKLISYSALVTAVLTGGKEVQAQIIYTDLDPDITSDVPDVFLLDLNNDGTTDFKFNLLFDSSNPGNQIRGIGYGNNAFSRDQSLNYFGGYYYARALNAGDHIGASLSFKSQVILGTHYFNGNDFGDWPAITDGYLGLKLVVNSDTYYGWVRLTIDANCAHMAASDYAVDTVANETAIAGDKCGDFAAYANTLITPADSVIVCAENVVSFSTDSVSGYTFQWLKNNQVIPGATDHEFEASEPGNYSVIITTSYGCIDTSATTNFYAVPLPPAPVITQTGNTLSSTAADSYQWSLNGSPIAGATGQTYDPSQGGEYTVKITDQNGCSNLSASFIFIPVGISETNEVVSSLYVSNNVLFIELRNEDLLGGQLKIFNAEAVEVYASPITGRKFQLDLNKNERGIYLVNLHKDSKNCSGKIVIQ